MSRPPEPAPRSEWVREDFETYIRCNVTRNTKGFTDEATISVRGIPEMHPGPSGELEFYLPDATGRRVPVDVVLDSLHRIAWEANQREIARQRAELEQGGAG